MNYLKILLAAAALWYFFNPPTYANLEQIFAHYADKNIAATHQTHLQQIKIESYYGKYEHIDLINATTKIHQIRNRIISKIKTASNIVELNLFTTEFKNLLCETLIKENQEHPHFFGKRGDFLKKMNELQDAVFYILDQNLEQDIFTLHKIDKTQKIIAASLAAETFLLHHIGRMTSYIRDDFQILCANKSLNNILGGTLETEIMLGDFYSIKQSNWVKAIFINKMKHLSNKYKDGKIKFNIPSNYAGQQSFDIEFVIDTTNGIREDTIRRTFYYYVYKQPVELVTKATFTAKTGARLQLQNGFTGGEIALDSLTQNADIQYFFPQVDSFATPKNLVIEYPDLDNNLQRSTSTDGKIPASVLAILAQRKRVSAVNIFSQRPMPSSLALILKP